MARPFYALVAALALACTLTPPAAAQSSLASQLETDRLGWVQPGTYQAGDDIEFTLDRYDRHYLLRFAGSPEVFVLYARRASLGGRVLKYDSGKTAMQIAGWGGITLYTDKRPGGLPAVRTGGSTPPQLPAVSLDDIKTAAADESKHLAYAHGLTMTFEADWDTLTDNAKLRALCFDAMENAARGFDRFAKLPAGLSALKAHVSTVFMRTSGKPTIQLKGHELIVTYDPDTGYIGRASSRAIAHALHTLFHIHATNAE